MAARSKTPHAPAASSAADALVEAVPLPAALLDDRGRIVRLNSAWEDQAQPGGLVAPTDEPGQDHVHDLREGKGFSREAGRGLADILERVVTGERSKAHHRYHIEVDGEEQHWVASATRMELDDEPFVLLVHQNVTSRQRADAMGQRMADLLIDRERHNAMQQDRHRLITSAEQSFHAPLTPIRLQLHLLSGGTLGELNERQQRALDTVERNVTRWWRLQEEFLSDLQALEDVDQKPQSSDLVHLVDEALQPFRERALKAGIRLRVDRTDSDLPVHVARRAIVQVILLVLDHAIRQTPSGGLVWVRVRREGEDAEVVIQDQDPTIDPQEAETLLSDQGTSEASLRSGLLHARRVIHRHEGALSARCEGPGQGLEVRLSLPLDNVAKETRASATGEASRYI